MCVGAGGISCSCLQSGLYGYWTGAGWECDMNSARVSIGTGNTMVLLFSAEMELRVWRYLS